MAVIRKKDSINSVNRQKVIGLFVVIFLLCSGITIDLISKAKSGDLNIALGIKQGELLEIIEYFQCEVTDTEIIVDDRVEFVEIAAMGDFLMHLPVINSAYDYNTGKYDFTGNLEYVNNELNRADLTIANIETTFNGAESGYSGYPAFNCPDELAVSMKECGIDIVNNISNHSLDRGQSGFLRTRQVLKESGLDVIGTRDSENDTRYIIKEINDINVGVMGYSYATNNGTALNGIPIPESIDSLANYFDPYNLEQAKLDMSEQINAMRDDGAELIVLYMHWGEEYQLEPTAYQVELAQFLCNEGVDVIFGGHPHTMQPIDVIKSENSDHEMVVVYSLGNFISNQRQETVNRAYTEDGAIVYVRFMKEFSTGEIILENIEYIPTWVKWESNGSRVYKVVPATKLEAEYLTDYESQRVLDSCNRTIGVLGKYTEQAQVFLNE